MKFVVGVDVGFDGIGDFLEFAEELSNMGVYLIVKKAVGSGGGNPDCVIASNSKDAIINALDQFWDEDESYFEEFQTTLK
jgi:hypothetical protein